MRDLKTRSLRVLYLAVFFSGLLLVLGTSSYAGYVGSPSRVLISEDEERTYSIFMEGVTDIVYDRRAKFQAEDAKIEFYGAKTGLIYKETFLLYGGAGAARVEEAYETRSTKVRWESDHGFTWLVGGTAKLYKSELKNFYKSRLLIDLDIQYRNTDLDVDTIGMDSVEYSLPHSEITYASMEYNDWHVAVACGLDMGPFSPYAGIRYSDFESCLRLMRSGVLFEKDNAEADDNLGIFIGAGLKIPGSLYACAEAGFIDQDSISASLSWKF